MTFALLVGAIPSPSDNAIGIGPLQLRAYGLAIAVGVMVAVWAARRSPPWGTMNESTRGPEMATDPHHDHPTQPVPS